MRWATSCTGKRLTINSMMATAADYVVAQVGIIFCAGCALSPEEIKTPHVYVDALVLNEHLPIEVNIYQYSGRNVKTNG